MNSLRVSIALCFVCIPVLSENRPVGKNFATRSEVLAHGMVCTSRQPLATQAGLDVLKQGGSAVDAAIAANAVLGVVEPMNCGMGGDLFAIVWDARTQKLYGLNASGRSPYSLTLDHFRSNHLDKIPERGPLSISTPRLRGWMVRTASAIWEIADGQSPQPRGGAGT